MLPETICFRPRWGHNDDKSEPDPMECPVCAAKNPDVASNTTQPTKSMSYMTSAYFGSPRGLISCCKTYPSHLDTVEVWGSSPHGPTISSNGLASTTSVSKAPNGSIRHCWQPVLTVRSATLPRTLERDFWLVSRIYTSEYLLSVFYRTARQSGCELNSITLPDHHFSGGHETPAAILFLYQLQSTAFDRGQLLAC